MLSHLFLNYLLDNGVAYSNFVDFNGDQPPLNEIEPESLVKDGVVPENLANSVLTNDDFGPDSLQYMTLTAKGQQLWEDGDWTSWPEAAAKQKPCIAAGSGPAFRFRASCG